MIEQAELLKDDTDLDSEELTTEESKDEAIEVEESEADENAESSDTETVESDGDTEVEETEEETIVLFDGESPPQDDEGKDAPKWIQDLRKDYRQSKKENKELKAKIEELTSATEQVVELGEEPTLEGCNYDEGIYRHKLREYDKRKLERDNAQEESRKKQELAQQEFDEKVKAYNLKKQNSTISDYEEVESIAFEKLSPLQQNLIVASVKDPNSLIYGVGKNPELLDNLSKIEDPIKFAVELGSLQSRIKVTTRKVATKPETKVTGSPGTLKNSEKELERLFKEAGKSGNFDKYRKFKKQLKSQN